MALSELVVSQADSRPIQAVRLDREPPGLRTLIERQRTAFDPVAVGQSTQFDLAHAVSLADRNSHSSLRTRASTSVIQVPQFVTTGMPPLVSVMPVMSAGEHATTVAPEGRAKQAIPDPPWPVHSGIMPDERGTGHISPGR